VAPGGTGTDTRPATIDPGQVRPNNHRSGARGGTEARYPIQTVYDRFVCVELMTRRRSSCAALLPVPVCPGSRTERSPGAFHGHAARSVPQVVPYEDKSICRAFSNHFHRHQNRPGLFPFGEDPVRVAAVRHRRSGVLFLVHHPGPKASLDMGRVRATSGWGYDARQRRHHRAARFPFQFRRRR
jgi:hypothetical protein